MSVQAGIWKYDGEPVDLRDLTRLGRELQQYGPDGATTYCGQGVGMLYMPFHTTSESVRERQPHVCKAGHVLTWDGRLDNRSELISQLAMDTGSDPCDVEIVAAAFERWSTDCLSKLIGDWALALWNPQAQELVLARDYVGIRRIFYIAAERSITWCTHLEPLALAGSDFTLNEQYFAGYLALWPEAHLTPYRRLYSVPPGKFLRVRKREISVHTYWGFDPHTEIRYRDDRDYEEHFRFLFRQAVRRRLRSHVPILAELSGGLDSSSIVCMADDILKNKGAQTPRIDTFSSWDRNEPDEEDFRYFPLIEAKRGRVGRHVEVHSLENSSTRGYFEYTHFVGTPGFHGHPRLVTAKAEVVVGSGYRVLLSGAGGDEMSGQALDPRIQLADLLHRCKLRTFSRQIVDWGLLLRRPAIHLLWDAILLQLPGSIRARTMQSGKVDSWVKPSFAQKHRLSALLAGTEQGRWFWLPSVRDWVQTIATLSCQMTKLPAYAWETRYPYLDQSLVEFLAAIPTDQLLRTGERRSLIRRAFAGMLPEEIRTRRTKATSARFYSVALEESWNFLAPIIRDPLLARLGYINQKAFYAALVDAKNGKLGAGFLRLIKALSWELWLRDVVARGIVVVEPKRSIPIQEAVPHGT